MNDLLKTYTQGLSKSARRELRRQLNLPPWERNADTYRQLQQQQQKSGFFSSFGNAPGMGSAVETYEAAATWARHPMLLWSPAIISSAAVDSGNTPTTTLRPGLVMGIISASNTWTNYSPSATDGSQIAQGILGVALPMLDPFTSSTQAKNWGMIVGGPVQSSKLINLDLQARASMSPYFRFDDNLLGNYRFPWAQFTSKTAAYQVLSTDNGALFDNVGASGAVTFTLPALANGYYFGFRVQADQSVTVASSEGTNMIALNNASASSVAFSTGSQKIGGMVVVYTNPGATKWVVENRSAGTNTITVA